jgi:hypothetical protein
MTTSPISTITLALPASMKRPSGSHLLPETGSSIGQKRTTKSRQVDDGEFNKQSSITYDNRLALCPV